MKSLFKYLSLLLLSSLGACTSSKYIHHAPIEGNHQRLQEQYDLKFSGSYFNGLLQTRNDVNNNFQLSFSPIKSFGLQVGRYNFTSDDIISSIPKTYIDSWKGALGGYYFFESKQKKRNEKHNKRSKNLLPKGLLIDLYSGMEWKKIDHNGFEKNNIRKALLKSQNFFLESGIQYQTKYFGIGSTIKFNSLYFKKGSFYHERSSIYNSSQTQDNILLDHFLIVKNNAGRYNFMEGSIYLLIGDKRVNFYTGYNRNFQSRNNLLRDIPHIAYAGLNVNIDSFYNAYKKKEK